MKRTALKWGAALVACAGVFYLGACGDTVYDGRQDTVLTLDAPRVTAKAYPGVNIVSWQPVTGAQGYAVYVYENGVSKGSAIVPASSTSTQFIDNGEKYNLVNNAQYTYYVEAVSNTNPAREVAVQNSRGEASVKAIVPPAGTKALELAAYEGGYDGKTAKTLDATKDEYVLTADRIKLDVDAKNGQIYVDFPMKAYLDYTVNIYNIDLDHAVADKELPISASDTTNNVTGHYASRILGGGTYQVAITAKSRNGTYPSSEEIVAGKVEVKKLDDINDSLDVNADYLYVSLNDKTVRVTFNQLKKADGSVVPSSWYKVYRRVVGEYDTTPVAATINTVNANLNTDAGYYLDDTVSSVDVKYEYIVVITDGEAYATFTGYASVEVKAEDVARPSSYAFAYGEQTQNDVYEDVQNSVTWRIDTDAAKSAIKAYVLVKDAADRNIDGNYLNSEIQSKGKDVTNSLVANAGGFYTLVTSGLTTSKGDDFTAYLLLVVNESGKKEWRGVFESNTFTNK